MTDREFQRSPWHPVECVPMSVLAAVLTWCREHNASIRFQSNGSVSIRVNGSERRRKTLVEAWRAWVDARPRRSR